MKKNKTLIFFTVCLFIAVNFSLIRVGTALLEYDRDACKTDNGKVYFSIQHEGSPFAVKDLQKYKTVEKQLIEIDDCTYYEIYGQPLFGVGEVTEIFDTDNALNAVQVSENVQSDFSLHVSEGEKLGESDYVLSDRSIPVLAGHGFADFFDVGDRFSAEYLFEKYEFVIKGILEKDSEIKMSNSTYLLDGYIVMPAFELADEAQVTDGIQIHYANKTSGKLCSDLDNADRALKDIQRITRTTEPGPYSSYATMFDQSIKLLIGFGIKSIMAINIALIVILTIVLLLCFIKWKEAELKSLALMNFIAAFAAVAVMKIISRVLDLPFFMIFTFLLSFYPMLIFGIIMIIRKGKMKIRI